MVLSILETFELSYIANVLYLSTLKPVKIELYNLQTPSSRPSSPFPPKYSFHFMQLSHSISALLSHTPTFQYTFY